MEFYLKYDGRLKPNGNNAEKHSVRESFRPQLEELWQSEPLNASSDLLGYPPKTSEVSIIKEIKGIKFAPLVSRAVYLNCELEIILLWKDDPGGIINTGDIDNRLKTLFDALTCPNEGQIKDPSTYNGYDPYFILLEDDKLITSVTVKTNKLLLPGLPHDDVSILIKVITVPYSLRYCNIGL